MSNVYTVIVNGKEVSYGAYTQYSRHTDEEWLALCHKMVEENFEPEEYKNMEEATVLAWGNYISMSERYEALLEELPQSSFSKAGTHPVWVSEAVEDNTFDKGITQSDLVDIIDRGTNREELQAELEEYFELATFRPESVIPVEVISSD